MLGTPPGRDGSRDTWLCEKGGIGVIACPSRRAVAVVITVAIGEGVFFGTALNERAPLVLSEDVKRATSTSSRTSRCGSLSNLITSLSASNVSLEMSGSLGMSGRRSPAK